MTHTISLSEPDREGSDAQQGRESRSPKQPSHLRTLIVNGERQTQEQLSRLCATRHDLDVIGMADSGSRALDAVLAKRPDLLLLDSELPDMSAGDVLQSLKPAIAQTTVVVTAPDHAPRGDDVAAAVDYLWKPINRLRFDATIDRVVARHRPGPTAGPLVGAIAEKLPNSPVGLSGPAPYIVGEKGHRIYFLDATVVDYLTVDGNYVVAHLGDDEYLTRATMKHVSAVLEAHDFIRIERSLLVNVRRVAHVERLERGQFAFVLRGGLRLMSSRERSSRMRHLLFTPLRMHGNT